LRSPTRMRGTSRAATAHAARHVPRQHHRHLPAFPTFVPMTYVIVGSCVKDDACVEVCPVDCIHPAPGEADFETAEQLYIDPVECIDCDACVEACPVNAIFADVDVPEAERESIDINALFFAERAVR
jgi:ferredoxin